MRVDDSDIAAIAEQLGMAPEAVRSRYVDTARGTLKNGLVGGRCVFLEDGSVAKCSIYPARPERCRTWPFWPELVGDRAALERAARLCPGLTVDADPLR